MRDKRNVRNRGRNLQSGIVVPHKAGLVPRIIAKVVYLLVKVISFTIRFKWIDKSGLREMPGSQRVIFCIWHNRLALSLILFERFVKKYFPQRRLAAMVSASRDGALLTRILELFGTEPVRGSSSRRGPQALREMTTKGKSGYDLAITPDGPRGPKYVVQDGVISLASVTQMPIIPVSYSLSWKIKLNTWDKFLIPLPFSKCVVYLGEPIYVSSNSSRDERETLRQLLEKRLREITKD